MRRWKTNRANQRRPERAKPAAPSFRLRRAVWHLRRGGVLAYPTEAVWGLGCDPLNAAAVERIFRLKGRPRDKGLILIAHDWAALSPFLAPPHPAALQRALATWPGPVTWVFPARPDTPPWLCPDRNTLAVRVTAHPLAAALCRAFGGAIVSTSANPAGKAPARTARRVRAYFGARELAILPGPTGILERPTAIHEAMSGRRLR